MLQRIVILLLAFSINSLSGQSYWQTEDYSKWDHTNFRDNQLFHKTFSTTDPDYLLLNAAVFYMTNEQRTKLGVPILLS